MPPFKLILAKTRLNHTAVSYTLSVLCAIVLQGWCSTKDSSRGEKAGISVDPAIVQYAISTFSAAATLFAEGALREAGKETFTKMRELLGKKTDSNDLVKLEQNPESESRQGVIVEELSQLSLEEAEVLHNLAKKLNEILNEHHPETAKAFEVNMLRAKIAGSANISDNEVDGNASINAEEATIGGNFNVTGNKVRKGDDS